MLRDNNSGRRSQENRDRRRREDLQPRLRSQIYRLKSENVDFQENNPLDSHRKGILQPFIHKTQKKHRQNALFI